MGKLTGKRAFVTGGSRGIGAGIVRRFVDEGADVAFTYASSGETADALCRELAGRGKVLGIKADSGKPEELLSAIDGAVLEMGGLDVLVNNAALRMVLPIESVSLQDFDEMIAINVRGVFTAIQHALMYLATGGRIVTIGSRAADRIPAGGASLYVTSKAAVVGLSKAVAREVAARGITVNVVQPGAIASHSNSDVGERADTIRKLIPLERYGQPDEIANAVAYLASSEADYVTGAVIDVDGGFGL